MGHNMGCALVIHFRSAPFNVPTWAGHLLWGQIWESLVFRLHSKFGQIHLSIEASVTTTSKEIEPDSKFFYQDAPHCTP